MISKKRSGLTKECSKRRTFNNRSRHLLHQFTKSGDLASRIIKPGSGINKMQGRELRRGIHNAVTEIFEHSIPVLLEPDFRRAYGHQNPVKSALDTAASENLYFGSTSKVLSEGVVVRAGYGVCSGSSSIGKYPPDQKVYPLTEPMRELIKLANKIPQVKAAPKTNFNHISLKVYWGKKGTGFHRDIEWDGWNLGDDWWQVVVLVC